MAELVTIPISIFEYTVSYERPEFNVWLDRASVVQAVFDALTKWEPRIDDVDAITTGKTSEQGFTIKLPLKTASFFFGPASCKFTKENADWQTAAETLEMLEAALTALVQSTGVGISARSAAISLHLQPKAVPFITLLKPFVVTQLAALDVQPVLALASVVKWERRKVTIDGSGVIANGVFLRFEREFPLAGATHDEMAVRLRQDEEELFRILGVEEERT